MTGLTGDFGPQAGCSHPFKSPYMVTPVNPQIDHFQLSSSALAFFSRSFFRCSNIFRCTRFDVELVLDNFGIAHFAFLMSLTWSSSKCLQSVCWSCRWWQWHRARWSPFNSAIDIPVVNRNLRFSTLLWVGRGNCRNSFSIFVWAEKLRACRRDSPK